MMNKDINFSEKRLSAKDYAFYLGFADSPFAVSVVCSASEDGYIADWVISGIRRLDEKPRFLLRIQAGISATRDELEGVILETWFDLIRELAFSSANQGGLDLNQNALPQDTRTLHAEWHLFAHDRLEHFKASQETVASRTADMFMLIKSLGYVQAQKLIIQFEELRAQQSVPASTTTNRLTAARKKGLIPLARGNSN